MNFSKILVLPAFLVLAFFTGVPGVNAAKSLVAEAPINAVGTSACTTISNSAWTALVASNLKGRVGIFIVNKSTNTLYGTFDSSQSTSITPLLFPAGGTTYLGASDALTISMLANAQSSISACYVEVKQ